MIFRLKNPLVVIFAFMLAVAGLYIRASLTEDDSRTKDFHEYYKIYSLSAPQKLYFAGEEVPMNDFDVRERFDRELLTNVYWQSQTLLFIKRANRYLPTIEKILKENNIPGDFKYLTVAESGLQFNAVSPAGAHSYWQFLEKTGKVYGLEINEEVDERYHLEKSTQAACRYFKDAYKVFNNWALVAASYNMGIEGVRRQVDAQGVNSYYDLYLNTETARYLLRILALKEILTQPDKYGFYLTKNHLYEDVATVKVKVDRTIPDLAKFALDNGCNYKLLKLLNPWLRKQKLTVSEGKHYFLALPRYRISETDLMNKAINDTIDLSQTYFSDTLR